MFKCRTNKKQPSDKYYEVLESLKKNVKITGLQEYVTEIVCERMNDEVNPTVEGLMQCLDERFLKIFIIEILCVFCLWFVFVSLKLIGELVLLIQLFINLVVSVVYHFPSFH